jgi:hypothetical protein
MLKKFYFPLLFLSLLVAISCEKKVVEVRYAPVLFDLAAPDSVLRGATLPVPIFVSVFDVDGLGDIDVVYFEVTKPDSTPGDNAINLRDDGQLGDSVANDGTYSVGIVSSIENMPGDYIFRFSARDRQNNPSNHPEAIVTLY